MALQFPLVPSMGFLTKGVGRHKEKLTSFEYALRDAHIEKYNLVRVSSIFPPNLKLITREVGEKYLLPGEVVFCVLAQEQTNEPNRLLASSIGVAIPKDKSMYGYLSEHHGFGVTEQGAGDYAEDLAAEMIAKVIYGTEIDIDKAYDKASDVFKILTSVVKTRNVTQSAVVDKDGTWTTTVAAMVFIFADAASTPAGTVDLAQAARDS